MRHVLGPNNPGQVQVGCCALAIMTKVPRAGHVKTRLQPPLTAEEAAALNVCFLQDTAAAIANACSLAQEHALGVAVYTPVGEEDAYEAVLPSSFRLLPQRGHSFGERLSNASEDLLAIGFSSCCLIDSDSPTVTAQVYAEAVEVLNEESERIVLGPSDDGGYYLIGMRQQHRHLFEGIAWSTERVLEQTRRRAGDARLQVHILPTFFDIDDARSLSRLCHDLLVEKRGEAPATTKFLQQIVEREGWNRIFAQ